jgi:hypothetical protein
MKRIAQEAEVIARLDYLTGETHICVVSWPSMARRMERLYGKPFNTRGQVRRWKVEGLAIAFRKPRQSGTSFSRKASQAALSKLSLAGNQSA